MEVITLQAEQVHELLGREGVAIFDLRDRYSFEMGHIKGARPANDHTIGNLLSRVDRDEPILIYCYQGNNSIDLAKALTQQGYRQVFNLHGGWQGLHEYMQRPGPVPDLLYGVNR